MKKLQLKTNMQNVNLKKAYLETSMKILCWKSELEKILVMNYFLKIFCWKTFFTVQIICHLK